MEKILLVEPNYKNKYPPIGLMKISTYYKNKGDFVEFHKGLLTRSEVANFNKVFITTLFTFDFDMCVQTIRYYIAILGSDNVYVGGIAATIMPENFINIIPNLKLVTGQLTSSNKLGYCDNINIDNLELDYDMLWDISYEYQSADSYFIYTTRGCSRKCPFCAVKTLEPNFYDCNNIKEQVNNVDLHFGIKKQLLIMDNNILYSNNFSDTVDILKELGFGKENNKIKKNNNVKYYIKSLVERLHDGRKYKYLLTRLKKEFLNLKFVRINKNDSNILKKILSKINNNSDNEIIDCIINNSIFIMDFFDRYNYHKITRYIDFNQGLDSRLFDDEKAKKMGELSLKPCRIAFDNLKFSNDYFSAMERAIKYNLKYFSNYLLYNYDERPEDLWIRLNLNIQFCKKYKDIFLFSFPMKYASIEHTDRNYVGKFWNKKYLRAINVILNVTSGIVAKEEDFFIRAFGQNENEFLEILMMPDDFIRYRDFFEDIGLKQLWKICYSKLTTHEKNELITILERIVEDPSVLKINHGTNIDRILPFYTITKNKVEKNALYYSKFIKSHTII